MRIKSSLFLLTLIFSLCPSSYAADKEIQDLIRELKNSDPITRAHAAKSLAAKGPAAKEAVPYLIPLLKDKKSTVRSQAGDALAKIGKDAVPQLVDTLEESDDKTFRFYIAHALGKIPVKDAQTAYKKYMDTEGQALGKAQR